MSRNTRSTVQLIRVLEHVRIMTFCDTSTTHGGYLTLVFRLATSERLDRADRHGGMQAGVVGCRLQYMLGCR